MLTLLALHPLPFSEPSREVANPFESARATGAQLEAANLAAGKRILNYSNHWTSSTHHHQQQQHNPHHQHHCHCHLGLLKKKPWPDRFTSFAQSFPLLLSRSKPEVPRLKRWMLVLVCARTACIRITSSKPSSNGH